MYTQLKVWEQGQEILLPIPRRSDLRALVNQGRCMKGCEAPQARGCRWCEANQAAQYIREQRMARRRGLSYAAEGSRGEITLAEINGAGSYWTQPRT